MNLSNVIISSMSHYKMKTTKINMLVEYFIYIYIFSITPHKKKNKRMAHVDLEC